MTTELPADLPHLAMESAVEIGILLRGVIVVVAGGVLVAIERVEPLNR
jgi:hypothetical protein